MKVMPMVPIIAIAAALPVAATAASPLQLESRILAEARQAAPDGTTRVALVSPRHVGPGDAVVVQLAYRNTGAQPITGLVIANPVPRNLAYRGPRPGSAAPELSVDGTHFGPLASLSVALPGGARRPATPADVTHVRWQLTTPVAAGGSGQLAFKAAVR